MVRINYSTCFESTIFISFRFDFDCTIFFSFPCCCSVSVSSTTTPTLQQSRKSSGAAAPASSSSNKPTSKGTTRSGSTKAKVVARSTTKPLGTVVASSQSRSKSNNSASTKAASVKTKEATEKEETNKNQNFIKRVSTTQASTDNQHSRGGHCCFLFAFWRSFLKLKSFFQFDFFTGRPSSPASSSGKSSQDSLPIHENFTKGVDISQVSYTIVQRWQTKVRKRRGKTCFLSALLI